MAQKLRPMSKRQFRIGELADTLDVKKYVIRFWEKEFGLCATRSVGGQRFYTQDDLTTFQLIKKLLYTEGFTIAGARQKLSDKAAIKNFSPARQEKSNDPAKLTELQKEAELWKSRFFELKDQLVEIKKQVMSSK